MDENRIEIEELNLTNIGKGALPDLFQRELQVVLDNIKDINTEADVRRSITITIDFQPMKERDGAQVSVDLKSKLAAVKGVNSTIFINKSDGRNVAVPQDLTQRHLFGPDHAPAGVTEMRKGETA